MRMQKVGLILFLSLAFTIGNIQGQSIYAEGLGNGIAYSINYDYHWSNRLPGWGNKVGVGFIPDDSKNYWYVPVHVNYTFGGKNALELAGGFTWIAHEENEFFPSSSVMYRWRSSLGFIFRIGITSTFVVPDSDDAFHIPPGIFWFWPGVSVGWKL